MLRHGRSLLHGRVRRPRSCIESSPPIAPLATGSVLKRGAPPQIPIYPMRDSSSHSVPSIGAPSSLSSIHSSSLQRSVRLYSRSAGRHTKERSSERANKEFPGTNSSTSPPKGTTTSEATTTTTARTRIASGAAAATNAVERGFQRVVDDLNTGDLVSVVLIGTFTIVVLVSPFAIRQMKKVDHGEDFDFGRWQTDDPVDELAKLAARREWGTTLDEDGEQTHKNVIELLLKDVFKSQALQQATQEFVVKVLESERFKQAVTRLVKELWRDLVSDPETIAQVVKVLEIAIQNPSVKLAAQDLVLQVFVQEPQVRDALVDMLEQLGTDPVVKQAVVRLLTDSAHTTLNDPDLLDHSMEFATDVVGDDVVQQTAGEALRKSVGHAVRPATTVLLTATGVGLVIFGIFAVGYSRSSEQEAVLFETAARSLQSNAATGIFRILTWPARFLQTKLGSLSSDTTRDGCHSSRQGTSATAWVWNGAHSLATSLLVLPWRALQASTRQLSLYAGHAARYTADHVWPTVVTVTDQSLIVAGSCASVCMTGMVAASQQVLSWTTQGLAYSVASLGTGLVQFGSVSKRVVDSSAQRASELWDGAVVLVCDVVKRAVIGVQRSR